jgi:hypothetical protein
MARRRIRSAGYNEEPVDRTVSLRGDQLNALRRYAARTGSTIDQHIRDAIDGHLRVLERSSARR